MLILNESQQQVVNHGKGPLLVLAVPGAGKTRCLTERIISLIERDVDPRNILAITFTNKAANEMKSRIAKRGFDGMYISTFHSFCAKQLRIHATTLGYNKDFTIYDEDAQKVLMRQVVDSAGFSTKEVDPRLLVSSVEKKRNALMSDTEFQAAEKYYELCHEYLRLLKLNNAIDFTGLIDEMIRLLRDNPKIAEAYSTKYKFILVDEFQDTNVAQLELVKLLTTVNKNVMVVGDQDQCFPAGTIISTNTGDMPIENICQGDIVKSVIKPGLIDNHDVMSVISKPYKGKLVKITLDNGKTIKCTPNHLLPIDIDTSGKFIIYLMYKADLGYRIGMCKATRKNNNKKLSSGIKVRLGQEHADAIWIIDIANSKPSALVKEHYYAIRYGIPTMVFHTSGRSLQITDEQIHELYNSIDTRYNALKLLDDKMLSQYEPHYVPRMNASKHNRITLNILLCADRGMHKFAITTNLKSELEKIGTPRKSKLGNWRIESSTTNMDKVSALVDTAISTYGDRLNIHVGINADKTKTMKFHPAMNAVPGSITYYYDGNIIKRHVITNVEYEDYNGIVYDLNMNRTHNYIANGFVVHNCIYSFRLANYENVLKFKEHFSPTVIKLENNYRSTNNILRSAMLLIEKNEDREKVKLISDRGDGHKPIILKTPNDREEAYSLAMKLQLHHSEGIEWNDMAILYRINALSARFEQVFRELNIPYVLIGSFSFFDRREIKTALSYLKYMANPNDMIAFDNCISFPSRGVGPAAISKLSTAANKAGVSLHEMCKDAYHIVKESTASALAKFYNLIEDAKQEASIKDSAIMLFENSGMLSSLSRDDGAKGENRTENVEQLINMISEFSNSNPKKNVTDFLQDIALTTAGDEDDNDDKVKLMTIHASKGLEFSVIGVAGCEEGILPHKMAIQNKEVDEERRLCYVAMTRAKDWLYMSHCESRLQRGEEIYSVVSRFLKESKLI